MALPCQPKPVKLICGMISYDKSLFDDAQISLQEAFGTCDIISDIFDFDFTHYYDGEMGSPLWRRFVAFEHLADPGRLAWAKRFSNELEARFAALGGGSQARPINLDMGYVEQSKLVLASMKNFSHRIYLADGVYAEVTLAYHKAGWQSYEWTFPDYASGRYRAFLDAARSSLLSKREPKEVEK